MPGGTAFARPTGFVGPVSEAPPGNWAALRPDALTPALSHGEREKTLGRHCDGLLLFEQFVHHARIGQR